MKPKTKISPLSIRLLEEFDASVQQWCSQLEQGTGDEVSLAERNYMKDRAALHARLVYLEQKVAKLKKEKTHLKMEAEGYKSGRTT